MQKLMHANTQLFKVVVIISLYNFRVWRNDDYCEYTANRAVVPESMIYDQSDPTYAEIKTDRITTTYSDYREPKDLFQIGHNIKGERDSIAEKNSADSETHFT